MDKFVEWLKQQSTQKAILAALAAAGIGIDPDKATAILTGFLALYALIAGIRDKS